jgi:hypothetical protein
MIDCTGGNLLALSGLEYHHDRRVRGPGPAARDSDRRSFSLPVTEWLTGRLAGRGWRPAAPAQPQPGWQPERPGESG